MAAFIAAVLCVLFGIYAKYITGRCPVNNRHIYVCSSVKIQSERAKLELSCICGKTIKYKKLLNNSLSPFTMRYRIKSFMKKVLKKSFSSKGSRIDNIALDNLVKLIIGEIFVTKNWIDTQKYSSTLYDKLYSDLNEHIAMAERGHTFVTKEALTHIHDSLVPGHTKVIISKQEQEEMQKDNNTITMKMWQV